MIDRIQQLEADELAPIAEAVIARIGELGRPAREALQAQLDQTTADGDNGTLANIYEGRDQLDDLQMD